MKKITIITLLTIVVMSCNKHENAFLDGIHDEYAYSISYEVEEVSYTEVLSGPKSLVDENMERPQAKRRKVFYGFKENGELNVISEEIPVKINMEVENFPIPDDLPYVKKLVIRDGISYSYGLNGELLFSNPVTLPNFSAFLESLKEGNTHDFTQLPVVLKDGANLRTKGTIRTHLEGPYVMETSTITDELGGSYQGMKLDVITDTVRGHVKGYTISNDQDEVIAFNRNDFETSDLIPSYSYDFMIEESGGSVDKITQICYYEDITIENNLN